MPLPLFIYGTLHPDRAAREIAAVTRRLKPIGPATGTATGGATIQGRLLDLGEYPGLLFADSGDSEQAIPGEVFEVPDAATLAALDAYEGFRADDPETSLFLRVEAQVTMHDGRTLMCWVYVYNR